MTGHASKQDQDVPRIKHVNMKRDDDEYKRRVIFNLSCPAWHRAKNHFHTLIIRVILATHLEFHTVNKLIFFEQSTWCVRVLCSLSQTGCAFNLCVNFSLYLNLTVLDSDVCRVPGMFPVKLSKNLNIKVTEASTCKISARFHYKVPDWEKLHSQF